MEKPEIKNRTLPTRSWQERLRNSSFPPAAVLGAFSSFLTSALPSKAEPRTPKAPGKESLVQIGSSEPRQSAPMARMELQYRQDKFPGAAKVFRHMLAGIAVDLTDRIYVLADGEVFIFSPDGKILRNWKAPEHAQCLAVGPDSRVYLGVAGGVEIYSSAGTRSGGFRVGEAGSAAAITSVKCHGGEILLADASAKIIRRCDPGGKQLGILGSHGKMRGFMLPNGSLDMDVDAKGIVYATDSGRHRVSSWTLGGAPTGSFGKFGQAKPEDFVGCCNPVNLAVSRDGKIVTAEKVLARVKVYSAAGHLMGLIGPEHFDPQCRHLHLTVDSKGRIFVGDPVRLEIQVFSPDTRSGAGNRV